jgi:hypothetical protein
MGAPADLIDSAAILAAAALYLLPTAIALARGTVARVEVLVLNVTLGWTGAAWIVALVLAFGPRVRRQTRPTAPPRDPRGRGSGLYRDGWYILGSGPESSTWAVHEQGRWWIASEVDGRHRLLGSVPDSEVPMAVRSGALAPEALRR